MSNFLHTVAHAIVGSLLALGSFFSGGSQAPVQSPIVEAPVAGATNAIPTSVALFEDSLASKITSTQTTLTLVRGTDKTGTLLASSTYAFIVDEGLTTEEFVLADCTGTTCTNVTRGISPISGTTTVAALQFEHRRGASVKITDGPQLMILSRILNGIGSIPNKISYTSHPSFSNPTEVVDKKYVDDTAFSGAGVVDANSTTRGVVELAANCEAASSTPSGSSGVLVIPASGATSTPGTAALGACKAVIANNSGKIDRLFLDSTIVSTSTTANFATSSINIGAFPAYNIGKNIAIISSTGTTSFPIPSGVTKLQVQIQAAGGGSDIAAGGGGGYCYKNVDVSATTSVQVFVGTGGALGNNGGAASPGTWSTFGTNGFYAYSTPGLGAGASGTSVGTGGTGVNCDFAIQGKSGSPLIDGAADQGGTGGDTPLGFGGIGVVSSSGPNPGQNYGAGAGGVNSGNTGGAAGAQGLVIISW